MSLENINSHILGLTCALLFFFVGLFVTDDYGQTIDEQESYVTSQRNIELLPKIIVGDHDFKYPWQALRGYRFVFDLMRGGLVSAVTFLHPEIAINTARPGVTFNTAIHIANLFFTSLSIYLLFMLVVLITSNKRVALLTILTMSLMPQFIAHSQNNPKDMARLFTFLLMIYLAVRIIEFGRWRDSIIGGVGFGLALTTSTLSCLTAPIIMLWGLAFKSSQLKKHWKPIGLSILIGLVCFLLFWPWLWDDPAGKIERVANRLLHFKFRVDEIYLGNTYSSRNLPWHYFSVIFLATTPIVFIGLTLIPIKSLFTRTLFDKNHLSLFCLAFLWILIPALVEATSSSRYSGIRHFILIIPGFCILAGMGADELYGWLKKRQWHGFDRYPLAWMPSALIATPFLIVLIAMVSIHPYQVAYLNSVTNALIQEDSHNYFPLEYFGHAFKEGGEWLNDEMQGDDKVFIPFFGYWATFTLDRDYTKGSLEDFKDTSTTNYLMYITRVTEYDELIRYAEENLNPVYTIERQKGTLLKIYRN